MVYLEKSQPAPDCLEIEKEKANGSYNCNGVLERLKNDFKNKCYVCESKEPHTINTEHFLPHKGDKDLKFSWDNLFYCCGHCNNTKLAKEKYDDILNCTVEQDAVDSKIKYQINPFPKEKVVVVPNENTERVLNTVDLLLSVYNGTTELKTIESANIRNKLLKEIREFQNLLFEFFDDSYEPDEKAVIKNAIIRKLRPSTPYTAFKIWIIRDNQALMDEFGEHI
ncbi:HNH endonuclease [Carboxylicivirga linearis]|uniref:TIGR02646 family protein n=1 Tax=Carboxylicivirga linearis TaxID=1628157 RepID=A0ABS5K0K9_9BACT|nr:hypothetical protein [Carboxylicivirga linearis]MBS2100216.1 hypothetical protein [Carboxylicivirga linearis]